MTSCERDRRSSDQLRDQTGEKTRLKYNVELLCEIRGKKTKSVKTFLGGLKQAGRCSNHYKEANDITTMPRKVGQIFLTTRFICIVSASHTFLTKFVPLQSWNEAVVAFCFQSESSFLIHSVSRCVIFSEVFSLQVLKGLSIEGQL